MSHIAKFGLKTPRDLFDKLKYDGELLLRVRKENVEEQRLEEYEAFNFFVTAWHLYHDWLKKGTSPNKPKYALIKIEAANPDFNEIKNVLRDIANGSKHFELHDPAKVTVGEREISSWFSYFYGPQFPIDTKSFHFLMYELVLLVLMYFDWVFDDTKPVKTPSEITDKLDKAREIRSARKNLANS
jgi:hypothetical protein